jgi:ankyrin repeat protein
LAHCRLSGGSQENSNGVVMPEGSRLEHYEKLVAQLLSDHHCCKLRAGRRLIEALPRLEGLIDEDALRHRISDDDAKHVIAREANFEKWEALIDYVGGLDEHVFAERFEEAVGAVIHGDADTLRKILAEDPALTRMNSPRSHAATLLHYNAANGVEDERQHCPENAVEIAEILLDAGADINAVCGIYGGGSGSTPLVNLVTSDHPEDAELMEDMIRAYAKTGQSLDGIENDGMPMASALLFRKLSAASTLAECGAKIFDVASAAALGRLDRVKTMIQPGDPPYAKGPMPASPFGWRYDAERAADLALLLASMAGEAEVVAYLIELGVNVNARLHHDFSPLHEAAFAGEVEIVRLLVEAGADLGARDRQYNSTPWGWAEEGEQEDVLRWFSENCAIDLADLVESGNTSLVAARLSKDPSAVNGADGAGVPLRTAAASGDVEMVKILLEHGADTSLTNAQGKTGLDWAEENGHGEVAVLLWNRMNAAEG